VLQLLAEIAMILGVEAEPEHTASRAGDVRHSSADLSAAARDLGWHPTVSLSDGLRRTVDWFALRAN